MKTVILVRHGKAVLNHSGLDDMDRPLRPRGQRDSAEMAERFMELDIDVHALVSSPALRSRSTAQVFAGRLGLEMETDERLYDGTDSDLLDVIQETDEEKSCILIVGHNPGLSDLLRDLLDSGIGNLYTASVAVIDFDVDDWGDVHCGGGTLEYLLSPDSLAQPFAA